MAEIIPPFVVMLPGELKPLILDAAARTGQSVDDFVGTALEETSQLIIGNPTKLSERDSRIFLDMLESDAGPNESLRRVFQ